jgi:XTP/dITP diphosphohydrolase
VGNAVIKARACAAFTQAISFADDAGLEIDALGGKPGMYSRRFGGEQMPFPVKMSLLLEMLKDVPAERRTARFRCAVAIATPDSACYTFEDTLEGRIADAPRGQATTPSSMCRRWVARSLSYLPNSRTASATAPK